MSDADSYKCPRPTGHTSLGILYRAALSSPSRIMKEVFYEIIYIYIYCKPVSYFVRPMSTIFPETNRRAYRVYRRLYVDMLFVIDARSRSPIDIAQSGAVRFISSYIYTFENMLLINPLSRKVTFVCELILLVTMGLPRTERSIAV